MLPKFQIIRKVYGEFGKRIPKITISHLARQILNEDVGENPTDPKLFMACKASGEKVAQMSSGKMLKNTATELQSEQMVKFADGIDAVTAEMVLEEMGETLRYIMQTGRKPRGTSSTP